MGLLRKKRGALRCPRMTILLDYCCYNQKGNIFNYIAIYYKYFQCALERQMGISVYA